LAGVFEQEVHDGPRLSQAVAAVVDGVNAGSPGGEGANSFYASLLDRLTRDAAGNERDEATARDGLEHQERVVEIAAAQ